MNQTVVAIALRRAGFSMNDTGVAIRSLIPGITAVQLAVLLKTVSAIETVTHCRLAMYELPG
jgi:uncharacterized membrane protein